MTLLISEKGNHMTSMVRDHLSTGELDRKHGFREEKGFYIGLLNTPTERKRMKKSWTNADTVTYELLR